MQVKRHPNDQYVLEIDKIVDRFSLGVISDIYVAERGKLIPIPIP
jgi:hypothetical protein